MKAHVHYESAFEDYIRARGIPYVAVDEAKRAAFRDAKLKSFDFIVYSAGPRWLVDVKGRRWASRKAGGKPAWENWVTQADLDGLTQWEDVFGAGFSALLVFAYWLPTESTAPPELLHRYCDEQYVFVGVPLREYCDHAKLRSPKWGTVNVSTRVFATMARPFAEYL